MEREHELLWQRAVQCLGQTPCRTRRADELVAASTPTALPDAQVKGLVANAIRADRPGARSRPWVARTAAACVLLLGIGALAARSAEWIWPTHQPTDAAVSVAPLVAQATASADEGKRYEAVAVIDERATLAVHTLLGIRDQASDVGLSQLAATTIEKLIRNGLRGALSWSDAELLQLVAIAADTAAHPSNRSLATRQLGEIAAGCLATIESAPLEDAKLAADRKTLLDQLRNRLRAPSTRKR